MIARIRGRLETVRGEHALVDVQGVTYGVLVSPATAERLVTSGAVGGEVVFYTMYSIEGGVGMGNLLPRLVGFLSESELEFFALLITVSGLGVRKALRSLVIPAADFARAIEREDIPTLKRLPEIGEKTARKVIAELKGKAAPFAGPAVIEYGPAVRPGDLKTECQIEAFEILVQLQYPEPEARDIVMRTSASRPDIESSQELVQEIFRRIGSAR